jgi:hypothetical protein
MLQLFCFSLISMLLNVVKKEFINIDSTFQCLPLLSKSVDFLMKVRIVLMIAKTWVLEQECLVC